MNKFIPNADDSLTGMTQEIQVCQCGFNMLGAYPGASVQQRLIAYVDHCPRPFPSWVRYSDWFKAMDFVRRRR